MPINCDRSVLKDVHELHVEPPVPVKNKLHMEPPVPGTKVTVKSPV